MNLRFHLLVSDVDQKNEDFGDKKVGSRFSCIAPGMVVWRWLDGDGSGQKCCLGPTEISSFVFLV